MRQSIQRRSRRLSAQRAIEQMEQRVMFTTVAVTNLGAAADSFGASTSGWTGFLVSVTADPGQVITAIDLGTSAAATNGIFGTLLQQWLPSKGGNTPTPVSTLPNEANGSDSGTDSHLLTVTRLDFTSPFENSDEVSPTGAPPDGPSSIWGTGSYLHGVFGISGPNQTNNVALAYVVLKNGTTGTYSLDAAQAPQGGSSVGAHFTGTFDTTTSGATISAGDTTIVQPLAGQTAQTTFTVTLGAPLLTAVTVDVNTSDSTAVAGVDYDAVSTTLSFAPGETSKTVPVTVRGQGQSGDVSFFLNLSNVTGGATLATTQVEGTITAVPPALLTTTAAPVASPVPGQTTQAIFTFTLNESRLTPITADYQTADGTATAGSDYDAVSGTLTFAPGETTKTLPVTVRGVTGTSTDKTFSLNLSNPSGATLSAASTLATITASGANLRTFDARRRLTYIDADGHVVLLQLVGPGSGQASFNTSSGDANPTQIALAGTTIRSVLLVRSVGGATTLPDVLVSGALGAFGGNANIAGDISIPGGTRAIALGNASGGNTITLGQGPVPTVLRLGNVSDLSINATGPIAALSALSWTNTDVTPDTITTPALNALLVNGAFAPNLAIAGNLGPVRITGAITGGTWTVGGNARAIIAGSIAAPWAATFTGNVGALLSVGDFGGTLGASSLPAMRVGGDMTGSVSLGGSLGTLFVGGTINAGRVRSIGNINVISAGAVLNTLITAGISGPVNAIPTDPAQFTTKSTLFTFAVRGRRGVTNAFAGSLVTASKIRQAVVRQVLTDDNDVPFGIAAESIGVFADIEPGKRPFIWRAGQDPALLTFAEDFKVVLVS